MRRAFRAGLVRVAWGSVALVTTSCQALAGLDAPLEAPPSNAPSDAGTPAGQLDSSAAGGSAYARAVLADAPILYLRFSESSGVRAADSSGQKKDVVISGGPTRGRPSLIAGDPDPAVGMGATAQLLLDAVYDFPLAAAFTYELWVRPTAYGDLISNQVNRPELYGTGLSFDPQLPFVRFERWGGTILRFAHAEDAVPALGAVHHVVAVNTPTRPVLFVNGVRWEGKLSSSSAPLPSPSALAVASGVKGDIDELAIYDKALPDARILAHYALGRGQ